MIDRNKLIPGHWYSIQLDARHLGGKLIGQFVCYWNHIGLSYHPYEYEILLSSRSESEDKYSPGALFNIGLLEGWGEWDVTAEIKA